MVSLFWTIPIVWIIKNPSQTKIHMNFKDCYFMYSLEYVLAVDIIAYVSPIVSLIVFQILIYFALKKKDRIINPILDNLKQQQKFNKINLEKKNHLNIPTRKLSINELKLNELGKRKNSLDSMIFTKFTESSFNLIQSEVNEIQNTNTIITKSADDERSVKNIFFLRQGSFTEENTSINIKKKLSTTAKFDLNSCNITKTTINNFKKNKKAFRTLLFVSFSIIILWVPWIRYYRLKI